MKPADQLQFPFLHISFRKDLDVLFCRWRMPVEFHQFTQGYLASMQFARQHKARFWLHDLRLRNVSTEKEREWFATHVVSEAETHMAPGMAIAYLMSPLQHQNLVSETKPVSELISYGPCFYIRYFTHEHNALAWLQEYRQQLFKPTVQ